MNATYFIVGFLAGCFFSLVLSTFLARKVGQAVYKALKDYHAEEWRESNDEDDPANWWKKR